MIVKIILVTICKRIEPNRLLREFVPQYSLYVTIMNAAFTNKKVSVNYVTMDWTWQLIFHFEVLSFKF